MGEALQGRGLLGVLGAQDLAPERRAVVVELLRVAELARAREERADAMDRVSEADGGLAGLVSITAGADVLQPWAAIIAGLVGSVVLWGSSKLLLKLKIDDPLEAFPVHGACGAWGVIATALFMDKTYSGGGSDYGLLVGGGLHAPGGGVRALRRPPLSQTRLDLGGTPLCVELERLGLVGRLLAQTLALRLGERDLLLDERDLLLELRAQLLGELLGGGKRSILNLWAARGGLPRPRRASKLLRRRSGVRRSGPSLGTV